MEYVKHLWKGNRSLPFTYWVIFVIGNTILNFLLQRLYLSGLYDSGGSGGILLKSAIELVLVFATIYLLYSTVCVWRSANKYEGNVIWAILAKVAMFPAIWQIVYARLLWVGVLP